MGILRINLYSRKTLFQWDIQLGPADLVRKRSDSLSLNLFAYLHLRSQAKSSEVLVSLSVFSRRLHWILMLGKTYFPSVPQERAGTAFQLRAAQRAGSDPLPGAEKTQWEADTVTVQFLGQYGNGGEL